ncbi:3-oxo-tetronate kinase [Arthrobacter sp. EpRS71]|uniref:3-oxo-tetronate kinase n=1 Tax=Arthrobacter sp. EpRS71 TaxID=1743141 RepID=UPI0007497500|nr:3-oxo-tetronate kinase [Arthrobacter sp. EpRS71]KUM32542.1 Hrp-dependent type III effector protein [Arthrobacter sp. EpRS71]
MIGVIADDFTGGTDVAVAFRRAGLRVLIQFGVPDVVSGNDGADVVVIALKTRTLPADQAVAQSLHAGRQLLDAGAKQLFFKFCSTFDSTPAGNIGPVNDALADLTGSSVTVVVPSSPSHGRTQYNGHLFVHHQLLSDSPMRHHPLTPMTDARVPELLRSQTARAVSLVTLQQVHTGTEALTAAIDGLQHSGIPYAVVDAVESSDLATIGRVVIDHPFVSGAAGLAGGLATAIAERKPSTRKPTLVDDGSDHDGPAVALAGSCSARTLQQIEAMQAGGHPSFQLDAVAVPDPSLLSEAALAWYDEQQPGTAPLIYSSLPPEKLRESQRRLGVTASAEILETAMGLIARGLVRRGVQRVVVAGGETSGSVVTALHVNGGLIGSEAAPGVPWIHTSHNGPLALLLKSGNFGDVDFLVQAVSPRTTVAV